MNLPIRRTDIPCCRIFTSIPNLIILRTFSKMYGLAGLWLGYGIMPEKLADLLLRVKLPFSVNILAEQAGFAALEDRAFVEETRRVVHAGREELSLGLTALGCTVYPSQGNFLMFAPPMDALTLFEELLRRGIIIRPLTSYGLPEMLRVSIGNAEENREFLEKQRGAAWKSPSSHLMDRPEGKSTLARRLAEELNIAYLDTGAMFRSVALVFERAAGKNPWMNWCRN